MDPAVTAPAVVVPVERMDRATLAALAYARSVSPYVTTVRIAGDGRRCADDLARYLDEHAYGTRERPVLVVVPVVAARPRWLFPMLNWTWSRIARRLAHRPWTAVAATPYLV